MASTQRALAFEVCTKVEYTDRTTRPAEFYVTASLQGELFQRLQPLIDELTFASMKIDQLRISKPPGYAVQIILEENIRKNVVKCLSAVLQIEKEQP